MPTNDTEIARQEGSEFRSVRLELQADGGIRLHAYDMGTAAVQMFGRDEYEFWVTVPPEAVGRLAFELLKERFQDRLQAVTELRDFCKRHEIVNEFSTWT
jgi:hypothetical protein